MESELGSREFCDGREPAGGPRAARVDTRTRRAPRTGGSVVQERDRDTDGFQQKRCSPATTAALSTGIGIGIGIGQRWGRKQRATRADAVLTGCESSNNGVTDLTAGSRCTRSALPSRRQHTTVSPPAHNGHLTTASPSARTASPPRSSGALPTAPPQQATASSPARNGHLTTGSPSARTASLPADNGHRSPLAVSTGLPTTPANGPS